MPESNCYFIKSMLDTMLNPVCYKDRNGIYLGVNENFARQIAGLPEEEIIGHTLLEAAKKVTEVFPERSIVNGILLLEHVKEWDIDDQELFERGGTSTHEYEGICADGIKRAFLVNKSTFNNENGEIAGLVTVLQDITELNEVKNALEKNEERYRIIINQTGQVAFDYDINDRKISWSGAVSELIGFDLKDFESTDIEVWLSRIHPEEWNRISQAFESCIKYGENFCLEYRLRKMDESYVWVEENVVCLTDDHGKVIRALGVMKDITARKLAQERLKTSEENYRSFIQNFKGIAFQLDNKFFPDFMHGRVEEITGYREEKFLSGEVLWIDNIHPEDRPFFLKDIEKIQYSPYNSLRELEFRIIHKSGRIKWVQQTYQKILEKDGKPDKYQGTVYDITEKKEAEEALVKVEAARKKEIHHRIKNNLQVISSLLSLQAEMFKDRECIKDSAVLEAFRESQNRVISMALIHEELYKGGGFETLNFSSYIEKLVESLFLTYRLGNTDISLNMDLGENICFDMDTAVPLGIVINELVSNSLKHAFSGRDRGTIQIKLRRKENGKSIKNREYIYGSEESKSEDCESTVFVLSISDDGVGIPESFDIENPNTLGIQLVTSLVDQLDGELYLKRNNGTEFTIRFTVAENNNQALGQPSSN